MNNVDRFRELFLEFENITLEKETSGFDNDTLYSKMLELKRNKVYPYYSEYEFLDFCRRYRNSIVHQSLENKYLDFSDEFIEKFERIIDIIKNPETCLSKAISNLYSVKLSYNVKIAIEKMINNKYTYIPVYDDNKLVGVFSKSVVLNYVLDNELDDQTTFNDIKEYIDIRNAKEKYLFVDKNKRFDEVVDEYIRLYENHIKLACVFITNTGKTNEKILGLLTAWDIAGKINQN